jgi:hypothetical protein
MIGEHEDNMISVYEEDKKTYCKLHFYSKFDKKKEYEIKYDYSTITW